MKSILAILIGAASISALPAAVACSPSPMNEQIARQLDSVLIGEVVNSTWDESAFELFVTVKVEEAIKGARPPEIVARFPCFQSVDSGRRVIVFVKGGDVVAWHSEYYEDNIRSILRAGR